MRTTQKVAVGAAGAAAGLGLLVVLASRPTPTPSKSVPPCQPWPECAAVSTPTPAPTLAPVGTPTASATVPAGSAVIVGMLPDVSTYGGGKFQPGYRDSLAVTSMALFVRENYGISSFGLGPNPHLVTAWDIESRRPTYAKNGDGYQEVVAVAASDDGSRIIANWKTSEHGTLLLDAAGRNAGEWAPPRCEGGVAVGTWGGKLYGLALSATSLSVAPIDTLVTGPNATKPGSIPRTSLAVPAQPVERSLVAAGRYAAYVTGIGQLVVVRDGDTQIVIPAGASSVAIDNLGTSLVVGVRNGYALASLTGIMGTTVALPATPSVTCLHHGVAYAVLGDGLYANGTRVLSMTVSPKVLRARNGMLYLGDGDHVYVIQVTP